MPCTRSNEKGAAHFGGSLAGLDGPAWAWDSRRVRLFGCSSSEAPPDEDGAAESVAAGRLQTVKVVVSFLRVAMNTAVAIFSHEAALLPLAEQTRSLGGFGWLGKGLPAGYVEIRPLCEAGRVSRLQQVQHDLATAVILLLHDERCTVELALNRDGMWPRQESRNLIISSNI